MGVNHRLMGADVGQYTQFADGKIIIVTIPMAVAQQEKLFSRKAVQ